MDLIEQAIFTSARTARAHGYQVVASSPGMSESDRRRSTAWGPSEGALADQSPDAKHQFSPTAKRKSLYRPDHGRRPGI